MAGGHRKDSRGREARSQATRSTRSNAKKLPHRRRAEAEERTPAAPATCGPARRTPARALHHTLGFSHMPRDVCARGPTCPHSHKSPHRQVQSSRHARSHETRPAYNSFTARRRLYCAPSRAQCRMRCSARRIACVRAVQRSPRRRQPSARSRCPHEQLLWAMRCCRAAAALITLR